MPRYIAFQELTQIKQIFFPKTFSQKYSHVGYSYLSIPKQWESIVRVCIMDIEKLMWPKYLPFWFKRLIHYLATGNSIVRIKYWWAHRLRNYLTGHTMIQQIKDKFATLRIYGYFSQEMEDIINKADKQCQSICEYCGSNDDVQISNTSWIRNVCKKCRK